MEDGLETNAPFATVDDLESRWRELDEAEKKKAEVLLSDASVYIECEWERCGVTPTENLLARAKIITCSMVKRSMASSMEGDYSQRSITAGSFTEQITFHNPSGDMYLTSSERVQLKIPIRRQRIGFAQITREEEQCEEKPSL